MRVRGAPLLLAAVALAGWMTRLAWAAAPRLDGVRGDYVLHCGGCHGIAGDSGRAAVPRLHGRVGRLLCTDTGRRYATRLPNVAMVRGLDDARLARLMTFVLVDLGGAAGGRPYTAAEIARGRAAPLIGGDLRAESMRVWRDIDRRCPPAA